MVPTGDIIQVMMQSRQRQRDVFLFFLAFLLALGVRLLMAGRAPLSDFEAQWALQSWAVARGEPANLGPDPGYVGLTGFLFFLLGSSNFLARFWPALAGSLVVLTPMGLQRHLGRRAALVLAFGLALDPGLVALSRLAGGPMLAVGFSTLALVFWVVGQPAWSGMFAGLALISGPAVWMGVLGAGIAFGLARLAGVAGRGSRCEETESLSGPARFLPTQGRTLLLAGGGTILLSSTLFFALPSGLGAWADALPAFLSAWAQPSGVPALRLLLTLVFYQPLPLIAGAIATVRGWRVGDSLARGLSLWFVVALLLPMLYPGRQVYDVVWALLPLWALAAKELARHYRLPISRKMAAGQAAVVFILAVVFWLVLIQVGNSVWLWVILLTVPVMVLLTTVLVGLGWSWDAARVGLALGSSLAFGAYMVSALTGVLRVHGSGVQEPWFPPPATVQSDWLLDTVKDIALLENGRHDWLEIVSLVEKPSLQWALRGFTGLEVLPSLEAGMFPTVIITAEEGGALPQIEAYRGQDFVWSSSPAWEGAFPSSWRDWLTDRSAPVQAEKVILWVRSDLFPEESTAGEEPPVLVIEGDEELGIEINE